ncbi:ADP-ribosylglycohydrolase family protein [Balneolaceae bacterium ANBcel3]|nr:ADP-ribosylglycohydrolase family protein [Balneolaceae bacterium ANBcel3]
MSDIIKEKFQATCIGAALGEAIGMPAEGMTPQQVSSVHGGIDGFKSRPESDDFSPVQAGHSARQTEALLSVLSASAPLPDLQEFAFTLKQALNSYPEKWPQSTTFAWPPFPDGGHYTFSFAIPAARLLAEERVTTDDLVSWMQSLTPSSVVWQQSIWLYLRLLSYLYRQDPNTFDADEFLARAARFIKEAEGYFPGDYKIRRRMQVTEPLIDESLEHIAKSCGNVSTLAEDMITFVGVVFHRYHNDYRKALLEAANIGGSSEASCFYLGSLFGALGGKNALDSEWLKGYKELDRVMSVLDRVEETLIPDSQ